MRKQNQQGYGLAELILTLSILSLMSLGIAHFILDYINNRNATGYREHIENVIEQLQKYQYHKVSVEGVDPSNPSVWPNTLDNLMTDYPGQFWPMCSEADESNGLCRRPDGVPWSIDKISYQFDMIPFNPAIKLTFPMSPAILDPEARSLWATELMRLPFIQEETNKDLTVTIQNPLISQVYKEFITRDGNTELTDDWDVGDQAILNAKAISVRNQDNSQRRLGVGTVWEFLAKHRDRVYKSAWSCPENLVQTLHVSVNAIMPASASTEYVGLASQKPYADDKGSYWELGLEYNAKIKATGKWSKQNSGYLNVRLNCSIP